MSKIAMHEITIPVNDVVMTFSGYGTDAADALSRCIRSDRNEVLIESCNDQRDAHVRVIRDDLKMGAQYFRLARLH